MLTAILTNHLGWVATVAPLNNCTTAKQMRAKMSEISKFHPYNALWAQLGDLYGAVGNPTKISKTIVCGNESIIMNKLLNVLTYFIRCGEIRRAGDCEVIEQGVIRDILRGMNENGTPSDVNGKQPLLPGASILKSKGLTRTATCLKGLASDMQNSIGVMNDIPNVLAFNDSRFVRQELRIGNFSMDTGIEMNLQQKQKIQGYQVKEPESNGIKLLITNADNDEFECEAASEAIDYVLKKKDSDLDEIKSLSQLITANSLGGSKSKPVKLLWGIEPVKEGIIEEQWKHLEKNIQMKPNNESIEIMKIVPDIKTDSAECNGGELKRSKSLFAKSANAIRRKRIRKPSQESMTYYSDVESNEHHHFDKPDLKSHSSLSDLITANSVGVSDRLQWGIEPVKEGICHEEELHFQIAQKRIEMEHNLNPRSGVVFVLGDNDVLCGLKSVPPTPSPSISSSENLHINESSDGDETPIQPQSPNPSVNVPSTPSSSCTLTIPKIDQKKKCTHKKHSGVKFNFEQYPQIVTNYMKNKNLDLGDYDFLEKGLKLDGGFSASTSILPPSMLLNDTKIEEEEEEEMCECCANSRILQTPSNATELEFSSDDNSYPTNISTAPKTSPPIKRKQSIEVSAKSCNGEEQSRVENKQEAETKRDLNVINLPIPKSSFRSKMEISSGNRPGFVPSLFVGVTDHYISDMVLQVNI